MEFNVSFLDLDETCAYCIFGGKYGGMIKARSKAPVSIGETPTEVHVHFGELRSISTCLK